jgi:hypothetical protein
VTWLVVHLVATAVLVGVAWVVQVVVYPAFALVGPEQWPAYQAAHIRSITQVVLLPWLVQGISTVGLLLAPPAGDLAVAVTLALLALAGVILTFAGAVPAHDRLAKQTDGTGPVLRNLMWVHLVRSVVWSASAVLAAVVLAI